MYHRLPSWKPRTRIADRNCDHQRLIGPKIVMPDRGILGRKAPGSAARHHRVDREVEVEPLRELQPGLHPLHQLLSCRRITLFDHRAGQRRRRGARGVQRRSPDVPRCADQSPYTRASPAARDSSDAPAIRRCRRRRSEFAVVERGLAGGTLSSVYSPPSSWKLRSWWCLGRRSPRSRDRHVPGCRSTSCRGCRDSSW